MFGSIGLPELVLIFIVALLLFGPRKLPEIGRTVGKALGEFRRASNDLKRTLEDEVAATELREARRDLDSAFQVPASDPVPPTPGEPSIQPAEPPAPSLAPVEAPVPGAASETDLPPEPMAGEPR
ncbi:MAG: Sec-independent protein translocase protein TatB [Thermoanaerobaculaceae bacterium]|jgi:TatA/E family protein of Tat protein translocase|nr:Sec-independent protein translocase protein TatB [Thermoanaerobaculaceae bacterium]